MRTLILVTEKTYITLTRRCNTLENRAWEGGEAYTWDGRLDPELTAAVLIVLTLALAFFKQGLVKWLRRAVPYVQLASAVLLVLAGAYIIYYWSSAQAGTVLPR